MQPKHKRQRRARNVLANIIDGVFVMILLIVSFGLSYVSAKIFERIVGREISTSSGLELCVILAPWFLTIIYSRYFYVHGLKKRMGILKDLGFLKPKERKVIAKPSS